LWSGVSGMTRSVILVPTCVCVCVRVCVYKCVNDGGSKKQKQCYLNFIPGLHYYPKRASSFRQLPSPIAFQRSSYILLPRRQRFHCFCLLNSFFLFSFILLQKKVHVVMTSCQAELDDNKPMITSLFAFLCCLSDHLRAL